MTGLNDNFLLADDSMEPKQAPAAVINAFKDTNPGAEPELRDDVDLIAAATEELEVQLRDLDLLKQNIKTQGGMCQSLAMETQALLPGFISDERPIGFFTKTPSRTMLTVALEEVEEEKKSILVKIWDFIIGILKRIAYGIVKFFTGIDMAEEEEAARKAEQILKNKQGIDFAKDVISKLNPTALAVICAIETDKKFTTTYESNIASDRKLTVPSRWTSDKEISTINGLVTEMDHGIQQLTSSIAEAEAKDEDEREAPLLRALQSGMSINGAENIEYLKAFRDGAGNDKRTEALVSEAEKYKRAGAVEELVTCMRKMVSVMVRQFSLETKVVMSYVLLNKAVIATNNKIFKGV